MARKIDRTLSCSEPIGNYVPRNKQRNDVLGLIYQAVDLTTGSNHASNFLRQLGEIGESWNLRPRGIRNIYSLGSSDCVEMVIKFDLRRVNIIHLFGELEGGENASLFVDILRYYGVLFWIRNTRWISL